ncbi:MAG: SGNH/GDSL hydrolase family protein [Byssovorax sp.]
MRPAPAVLSLLLAACAGAPPPPPSPTLPAPPEIASAAPAPTTSAAPAAATAPTAVASAAPVAPIARPAAPPPIPTGTAVLHVGDSFAVAGFAQALKPHMAALGVRYEVRAETSSFTTTWAARMDLLVANTQPDLVIINLGANEFTNTDPPAHAPAIRRIVKSIGSRPCVWVSPPSWRKDTGITEVMRQNTAPCRFFDSDVLVKTPIPRQGDKIHPSEAGGAIWAEAFWVWLNEQRAPAEDGAIKVSPWRLLPAPPEEHRTAAALPVP